jgi:hypothetical protein
MIDFLKGLVREVFGSSGRQGYDPKEFENIEIDFGPDGEDENDIVLTEGHGFEDDSIIVFDNLIIKYGNVHYIKKGSDGNAYVILQQYNPNEFEAVAVDTGETFDSVKEFFQ